MNIRELLEIPDISNFEDIDWDIELDEEPEEEEEIDTTADYTRVQATTLNDDFWAWFGDSKMCDSDGNPFVYYHGTNSDFTDFSDDKYSSASGRGVYGIGGFYFTPKEDYAKSYGKKILKVYLSIKKPFREGEDLFDFNWCFEQLYGHKFGEGKNDDLQEGYLLSKIENNVPELLQMFGTEKGITLAQVLQAHGYDGFIKSNGMEVIAIYPNQIKSIDNNGDWSVNKSNIYEDLKLDPNKIYYHGTNHKFDKFDKSKIRENKLGLCFNFTDDIGIAYQYGNNIMKVHLDLKNPLTLDLWQEVFPYKWFNRFAKLFCDDEDYEYDKADYEKHPYTYGKFFNTYGDKPEGVQVFEEMGYDGIALPEDGHYGVFEPEQIHIINDVNESEDNFKKWFGNSKIVDEQGNPLVVYHGTLSEFSEFNRQFADRGFYFCTEKRRMSVAGYYAYRGGDGKIMPCYLRVENPIIVTPSQHHSKDFKLGNHDGIIVVSEDDMEQRYYDYETEELGVNTLHKGDIVEIIVFDPNQIKSVDNNGEWSRKSNNIYENEDNFKSWFGNSKVVDDNGNPLVVYHGSPKQFDTFKPVNYYDIVRPDIRPYTFFSDDKEFANAYGGNNYLYSCYLKIENPYIVDAKGKVWNNILESTILAECPADCDGIIIKNIAESRGQFGVANDYIVFNPNQIKSIDNNGEWSSSNNIYENVSDNFKSWFGDSITVDKDGNPLIFYHGTKQKFDTFKAKYDDKLIFFAYDEEFARDWAKSAPLTDEQKQIDTDLYFDKIKPYSNALYKKLNAKYGSEYSDDKYKEAKKHINRYENRLKKQAGLDDKVIPVYIKARKIFVPERDYELVLKDIIEYYNWADPTTPEYKEKLQRVTDNFNKVNAAETEWFKNNPNASDEEDLKHQHNIDYAYKFLAAQRSIKDDFDYHLDRIKTGAWAYFEHQVIIDKIFDELGFDAIQLSERQGKPTTLAVREGTNQIKSIYATEFKNTSNIYERLNEELLEVLGE